MNDFVQYQYVIAWSGYIGSGLMFCLFWWKVTSRLRHQGWRDLLRGVSLVVIYTPWFTSEAHEHLVPAIVVVLMDFLLGASDNGLAGSLALLLATLVMLAVLIRCRYLTTGSHKGG